MCGHLHDAHEHYRRGTDCAICGAEVCPRYRASRAPAPVAAPPVVDAPSAAQVETRDHAH